MGAVEPPHSCVERKHEAWRAPSSRAALDVERAYRWLVPRDPTGLLEAVAEVEVLHVHPVALVEESDLLECPATDEHEGAVDRVHRPPLHVRSAVLGERATATNAPDAGEVAKCADQRRKR